MHRAICISGIIVLAFNLTVSAQSPGNVKILHKFESYSPARDSCGSDNLTIELGKNFSRSGSIEILVPLPDTHGRDVKRYLPSDVVCLPFSEILGWHAAFGASVDSTGDNAQFYVTYDPSGTLTESRSRYDYEVLMCEELADTPKPPSDLQFGFFTWAAGTGIKALKVEWNNEINAFCD